MGQLDEAEVSDTEFGIIQKALEGGNRIDWLGERPSSQACLRAGTQPFQSVAVVHEAFRRLRYEKCWIDETGNNVYAVNADGREALRQITQD